MDSEDISDERGTDEPEDAEEDDDSREGEDKDSDAEKDDGADGEDDGEDEDEDGDADVDDADVVAAMDISIAAADTVESLMGITVAVFVAEGAASPGEAGADRRGPSEGDEAEGTEGGCERGLDDGTADSEGWKDGADSDNGGEADS